MTTRPNILDATGEIATAMMLVGSVGVGLGLAGGFAIGWVVFG